MSANIHDEDDDRGLFTNKSTMMANFEQWIKMATDNKINSRNSWNFALIDYFHDLNVLKDAEDNINFQKASATLDGCVKIYSSRVDSVANETGILLSGLAQRKNPQQQGEKADEEDGTSGTGDNPEGGVTIDPLTGLPVSNEVETTSRRRNYNRVLETTLVDFESIKMRELDQELSIDPLFKKALADFDEGGAKSLLLNTLNVDSTGRVVFDATASHDQKKAEECDITEQSALEGNEDSNVSKDNDGDYIMPEASHQSDAALADEGSLIKGNTPSLQDGSPHDSSTMPYPQPIDVEDEILALGMDFINFKLISQVEICPSIKRLRDVVDDVNKAKSFIDDVNNKFDNFLTEKDMRDAVPDTNEDDIPSFELTNDNNGGLDGGFYDDENPPSDGRIDDDANERSGMTEGDRSTVDLITSVMDRDVMAYFDETMKKSWRGREHWKVRNFKNKIQSKTGDGPVPAAPETNEIEREAAKSKKTTKQKFVIDFFNFDNNIEEQIFDNKKKASIEIPQKLRTNSTHYLLPNDYQFSTQRITRLFIKPEQHMSFFSHRRSRTDTARLGGTLKFDEIDVREDSQVAEIADQNFWAQNYQLREQQEDLQNNEQEESDPTGGLPNPFEENEGEVDFNQAFGSDGAEEFDTGSLDPAPGGSAGLAQPLAIPGGKVTYSRVSKKVDVKRLKDNIWKAVTASLEDQKKEGTPPLAEPESAAEPITLKFTDIAERISKMYSGERKKDLSTSFCFICLLHLANEHGFTINPTEDYDDLKMKIQA